MFDAYLSAYQTAPFNDDQGRPVEYLTPRYSFDPAICGTCALSGRLIYSQRDVIEIIHSELVAAHLKGSRVVVPLELSRDALTEAALRFEVLILNPSAESSTAPIFIDDDRP